MGRRSGGCSSRQECCPFDKALALFHRLSINPGNIRPVPSIGPFNRRETRLQTSAVAIKQVNSGEIWGRTAQWGMEPTVQAYAGVLPNCRGIEFTTPIAPHPNGSPFELRWYLTKTPGVLRRCEGGETFACIPAVVKNMQP